MNDTHPTQASYDAGVATAKRLCNRGFITLAEQQDARRSASTHDDPEAFVDGFNDEIDRRSRSPGSVAR